MSTKLLAKYWPKLHDKNAYMAAIANRLDECVKKHTNVRVRLGTKSTGSYPSFRITYGDVEETVYNSYVDTGTPFPKKDAFVVPGDWGPPMTPGDIIEFLASAP
jgi:hypothetical protein